MTITLTTLGRNSTLSGLLDAVDGGASFGKFKLYSGGAGGTLLATFTLQDPAFSSPSGGSASINGVPMEVNAVAPGTANAFEVTDSDDNVLWTGSVTTSGGGGDAIIDNTTIANGQTVRLNNYSHTQPA